MAGLSGLDDGGASWFGFAYNPLWLGNPGLALLLLILLSAFVWLLPNTQDWLPYAGKKTKSQPWAWRPTTYWAAFNAISAVIALVFMLGRPETQEFLYFQF